MKPRLEQIAQALGGVVSAGQICAPAPGHSAADRGMCLKIEPDSPDGFIVNLFNGGDPIAAKDYVRQKLGLPAWKPNGKGNGHAYTPPGEKFGNCAPTPKISAALQAALKPAEPAPAETEAADFARQCADGSIEPSAKQAVRTLTAKYDYRDLDGTLLYEVLRYEPKSFAQRAPNGTGGYSYTLDGVPRVLYRLPELMQFPSGTVFICEGEKDANAVAALGLCATTISGGTRWEPELAAPLKGRDVLILPDNDAHGMKRAEEAATALQGIAGSIRIVELPDLPDKGDVSDWLDAGNTKEQVEQICLAAPLWEPQASAAGTVGGDIAYGVTLDDFIALLPTHTYVFIPSRETWPAVSVNAKVPPVEIDGKKVRATDWLDAFRCAVQMTWLPGAPLEIRNRLIADGGWVDRAGVTCLNTYRPPTVVPGNAAGAGRWIDHCYKVYPDDADRLIRWCAHRVQHPQQKCNHALFLGGAPGIGKDTLLAPLKQAVGPWNFQEVAPKTLLGQFNGYAKTVVLRISEARDLGDTNRFAFYDTSKVYCAAPPDVLRVNEKHLREHYVPNCCGIIFTSNYRSDGLYLPADDRRHDVMWSDLTSADFTGGYWIGLWDWYNHGGFEDVAAYLRELDICDFDPAAPPPKTAAFWAIVDAGAAPEDAEVADVLDRLGNPPAVTLAQLKAEATGDIFGWLADRKNRRAIPHRLEKCGYIVTRNEDNKQGLWIVRETRQAIYTRADLSATERYAAATEMVRKDSSKH